MSPSPAGSDAASVNVLIVDDHPIMRLGSRQLIEREWPDARVNEAETLADALSRFTHEPSDVVLLDLQLPDADGVDGLARMLRVTRDVPILVMSANAESSYALRVIQLGARGFLPKDRSVDELTTAIRRLLQGGRYMTAAMADRLVGLFETRAPTSLPHERLTDQEFRVMQLIAAGHAPAHIAKTMSLSVKTVGSYRARIFAKTGWQSNTDLTKYCVQHGLTTPD